MTALALSMMTGGNSPDRAAREHGEHFGKGGRHEGPAGFR